jgi:hypothetical protein
MSCSVHKRVGMLRTPSTSSSIRHPGSLMEILAAVRVVAQPDRQCQLGKADRRRVALVRWFDLRVRLGLGREAEARRAPKSRPTACLSASADTVRHASSRKPSSCRLGSSPELDAASVSTLSLIHQTLPTKTNSKGALHALRVPVHSIVRVLGRGAAPPIASRFRKPCPRSFCARAMPLPAVLYGW